MKCRQHGLAKLLLWVLDQRLRAVEKQTPGITALIQMARAAFQALATQAVENQMAKIMSISKLQLKTLHARSTIQ